MKTFFRFLFPRKKQLTQGSLWIYEAHEPDNLFFPRYQIRKVQEHNNKVIYDCLTPEGILIYKNSKSMPIRDFYAFYRKIKENND